jgi:hypothetical protein
MNRFFLLLFVTPTLFLAACTSNEIGSSKDVNPETIFFDYKIWGEEGNDNLTVMLQYRFGGQNGTTLTVDKPGKVELDGEVVRVDSSRMSGAYYEVQKPIASFAGQHIITFTDVNKKQYSEPFSFQPFSLRTKLPATISRGDFVFELDGLEPEDYVRVLLTDTSFTSEGINRIDTVKNGRLIINKAELENLANGPIHLELSKEIEKRVKNGTNEGGRLSVTYGVKREFILKN